MIAQEFDFFRPTELSDALSLLAQESDDVRLLAGGMTLLPAMNLGIARPDVIVSLNHIASLNSVVIDVNSLRLGALSRHRRIETDNQIRAACPLLAEAAAMIADIQVRHRGTVGGSLAHADPSANYIPAVIALGASFKLVSSAGERWVLASDFIKGALETDLRPNEILAEVSVPLQEKKQSVAYYRLARTHGSFAIANAAAIIDEQGSTKVIVAGTTPRPIVVEQRLDATGGDSAKLIEQIGEAALTACHEPIEDLFGGSEYRRSMTRVAAKRAVSEALRRRSVQQG
jgi:carbon-monoxide dehydrogenase medium subunit